MKKSAKNKKRSAKSSKKRWNLLAKTSKTTQFAVLTLLLLAVGGVGWRIHTRAANEYSVRFVLFCATDACSGTSRSKVDHYARQVRAWYKKELGGGRTFRIYPEKKRGFADKVVGGHNRAWYGGSSMESIWYKIQEEGKLEEPNVHVVAILGWAGDRCGIGGPDYLGIVSPLSGRCTGYVNSAIAHELGHTWNLARTGNSHRTDNTLMNQPAACNSRTLGHCSINSADRSWLLQMKDSSSWFPSKQARPSVYFQPSDTDFDFTD